MSDRIKQSIPLLGINTATIDSIVTDGALLDAMNVRHKNGALQNVYSPRLIHQITTSNDYTIIHRMDALPENEYIARKVDGFGFFVVDHVVITNGVVTKISELCQLGNSAQRLKCHSFGNVLYVNYERTAPFTGQVISEITYIYKNGVFQESTISDLTPPVIEKIEISKMDADIDETQPRFGVGIAVIADNGNKKELIYAAKQQALKNAGFIIGGFFLSLAFKTSNGSLIKTSSPILLSSEIGDIGYYPGYKYNIEGDVFYVKKMTGIKVTIKLPETIINTDELIKSVTVLTTRIRTIHEIDKIFEKYIETGGMTGYYNNAVYPSSILIDKEAAKLDEPMYELCDIDFRTTREVVIDYDKIKDVIHNPIYTPSFSHHAMIGRGKMEYNNRLHFYDIQTRFYANIHPTPNNVIDKATAHAFDYEKLYEQTSTQIYGVAEYTIEVENKTIKISYPFNTHAYKKSDASDLFIRMSNIACYPDARATKLTLYIRDTTNIVRTNSLQLEKVLAHNLSYVRLSKLTGTEDLINQNTYLKVTSGIIYDGYLPTKSSPLYEQQTNRLQVSAMNNPFFVAAQNIYSIGETGSKIEAINIATEQVSETRFGAYPLYIFTDRAIHAMETGVDNVVYASIIGISNERKLSGTTTVGAANAVMFIGDKGVMALEGRYAINLSNDICETPSVKTDLATFETYYRSAQLLYNSKENELIVYNNKYDYAYIYSLYSKVWTRRTWSGNEIGSRQITTASGICSLLDEDATKPIADVQIVTRPLKLGAMELKRVETAAARIIAGNNSVYSITLEGSNDGQSWQQLGKVTDLSSIRRTPSSAIYHRLSIWADVKDWLSITHFDVEYYLRFARRMK